MDKYAIWFSNVKLSPFIKYKLTKNFKSFNELWYAVKEAKKLKYIGIKDKIINKLNEAQSEEKIYKIKEKLKKQNIKITTIYNKDYPKKLKNIVDPPAVLFYKGSLDRINRKSVGIVGSRRCTYYGENVTEDICNILNENQINIISGLAKGIDRTAHLTAIKDRNFTCGVLGCGINKIYPRENFQLYKEMEQNGLIISEYVPDVKPYSWNFPIRNRIISGLSDLLIVIEASEKSGSLITANLALEQGKDVMCIPGSIFSECSVGTNKLIKDGAEIFTCKEDLYEILKLSKTNLSKYKNIVNFNKDESKIYSILSDSPMHIDDIVKLTNIDIQRLYGLLFEMQTFSKIKCICGSYYVKVENLN